MLHEVLEFSSYRLLWALPTPWVQDAPCPCLSGPVPGSLVLATTLHQVGEWWDDLRCVHFLFTNQSHPTLSFPDAGRMISAGVYWRSVPRPGLEPAEETKVKHPTLTLLACKTWAWGCYREEQPCQSKRASDRSIALFPSGSTHWRGNLSTCPQSQIYPIFIRGSWAHRHSP